MTTTRRADAADAALASLPGAARISVAPMMDVTDRHCRYFLRQLAPDVRLYTEMITAEAVIHGDRDRLLGFDGSEHPVALQLGGHDPARLAAAAAIAADFGYDEINLNVGCPSSRVQDGGFGACLMKNAALVARCVEAMAEAVRIPVTVKTRIGVDDHDSYDFLARFVREVAGAGCATFVVHARKAYLQGLSPSENRSVPPLDYAVVYKLKQEFPGLGIVINGGIGSIGEIASHLQQVDGVMLGRKVVDDPYFLTIVQERFLSRRPFVASSREEVVRAMHGYALRESRRGVELRHVSRSMLGLYRGQPGARGWRRFLSEMAVRSGAHPDLLLESLGRLGERAAA
jgi:tRNA-dihydrouridine synthase A